MRIHQLTLCAFGPYPGEITVDFDALTQGGVFLLHGDTGVGKTTVLDAIAFALYGKVPGARGEARRLRSDSALPTSRTEVRLELSVGDRRLELVRNPEYSRPKSRGTGETLERAKASLRWLDDPDRPGLSGHQEVGDAVLDLLGMSADQFFQVVLLPQGEFARFLRSDTAERERVLERLFDTQRFGRVEEVVAEFRRQSHTAVAASAAEHQAALARWEQASGHRFSDDRPAHGVMPDLGPVLLELRQATHDADTRAEQTASRRKEAEAHFVAGQDLVARWRTRCDLDRRLQLLDADEPRMTQLRAAAELAAAAIGHAPLVQRREATIQRVSEAVAAERRAAAAVRAAGSVFGEMFSVDAADTASGDTIGTAAEPEDDLFSLAARFDHSWHAVQLRAAAAADRELAGSLDPIAGQAQSLQTDRDRLADLRVELDQTIDEQTTVESEIAALTAREVSIAAEAERAALVVGTLQAVESDLQQVRSVLEAALALPAVRDELEAAKVREAAAVDEHQRVRDERQRLVEVRIAGMAAELAGALEEGTACRVCGSVEHPHPAQAQGERVDAATLRAAEEHEQAAQSRRTLAHDAVLAAQERLAVLLAAGAECDVPELRQRVDDLAGRRVAVLDTERRRAVLLDDHRAVRKTLDQSAIRHRELLARRSVLSGESELLSAQLADRELSVEAAAAGFASVAERRQAIGLLATARESWAAALDVLHRADAERGAVEAELDAALRATGFPDVDALTTASRLDGDAIRRQLREHEDSRVAIADRLQDPQLVGISADVIPDLERLRAEVEAAVAADSSAIARRETTQVRREQSELAADALAELTRRIAPQLAAHAELSALADTLAGRGQNHRGVSLRTFVLQTRLRQVAQVAGIRLAQMSSDRFTFVPSEEKEGRGRSGGLGLDVLDAHTGRVRPAKTLSGGESFLASLALALGLSDVVSAESGGRVLDTIVIDEGFGTLDADTLELVMSTVDELRSGGRIVGLVSHVDDLRLRIPHRLHIRRGPQGPQPELVCG